MEILQSCFVAEEDLLDFTLDGAGGAEQAVGPTFSKPGASASYSSGESAASFGGGKEARLFPEFVEEELEWLSNKDAFPAVETCFGILSDNPELVSNNNNNQSPVSVLENSSGSSNNTSGAPVASCCTSLKIPANYPVRARTKRSRRRRRAGFADIFCPWMPRVSNNKKRDFSVMSQPLPVPPKNGGAGGIGRRCLHCQTDKTPQWRAGPNGPKTLCNACGVRYKSGRLLPEYRPANSPTFSSVLHSNSHRKVVEMRKQKEVGPGVGVTEVNVAASPCGYSVG